jgi:hypothetical protein
MQPDVGTPLFDADQVPTFTEPEVFNHPCEGQLADLQAAISNMATRVEAIVTAVNSVGEITETIQGQVAAATAFIEEFQRRFADMSPGEMIKTMLKGGG